ncbi:hypothetical protein ARMGADRAFT_57331 [Armillaria gallica]|uniref:Uncharacterized protein n=1 Tax=Armillaria gallica TaxID=47427 RepID=A0A2H3EW95_ARMGA|nr:hypothetical protein ARMGADRAFT_57331 [Armillaria gallica]
MGATTKVMEDPYQKAISWTPRHSIPSKFTRHILFSSNRVSGNGYSQGAAFLWSPGVQQSGHELEFLYPTSPISHPFFNISLIWIREMKLKVIVKLVFEKRRSTLQFRTDEGRS